MSILKKTNYDHNIGPNIYREVKLWSLDKKGSTNVTM